MKVLKRLTAVLVAGAMVLGMSDVYPEDMVRNAFMKVEAETTTKIGYQWHLEPSVEAEDIIVSDMIYDTTNEYNASYECAVIKRDGYYGVVNNTTGEIVIEPGFTYFKYETPTGYIVVANDNTTTEDDYTI